MDLMNDIILYIQDNYKWIFSGLGIVVIGTIFKKRFYSLNKVNQKNISAGGDVIGRDKK